MEIFRFRPIANRFTKYLAPLFVLVAASSSTFCQSGTIVSGRAVNDRGRPIPNALVTLYTAPAAEAFELILPGAHTLSGGEFFIDSGSIKSSMVFQLFIEEPAPKGFWSPFSGPPFGNLSRLSPFRGTSLRLKPNQARADLGDVKAGIQFAKVVIDLTRAWNTEARPSPEELRQGKLRIRDGAGNIVYDGRMPESALDPSLSSLNLALTRGKWMVELFVQTQSQNIQSPPHVINVKTLSCLRVALADKRVQKPCA
jgi:hypothetical protein